MVSVQAAARHLFDVVAILALGIVYVVALTAGTAVAAARRPVSTLRSFGGVANESSGRRVDGRGN